MRVLKSNFVHMHLKIVFLKERNCEGIVVFFVQEEACDSVSSIDAFSPCSSSEIQPCPEQNEEFVGPWRLIPITGTVGSTSNGDTSENVKAKLMVYSL